MQTIEPIQFEAQGPGIEVKSDDYTKKIQFSYDQEWDDTHDSLLSQSIPDDLEEISPETIGERMTEVFEDVFDPIENIAPEILDTPRRNYMFSPEMNRPRMTLWSKEDAIIVPNPSKSGNLFIITSNKDVGRDVRERLINNIMEKAQHLNIYGVEDIKIAKGSDYAKQIITTSDNVSDLTEEDPDEFEESVKNDLLAVTESILCSCLVDFGEHATNPEYDILLPLTSDDIINIEVKDYSGRDDRPTENEIISTPLNQARLLNINHVFSIAKGIDDELRQNFERSVELRDDIEIVSEKDVTEKVRQYIQTEILSNLVW
jgi:hypothetical protein